VVKTADLRDAAVDCHLPSLVAVKGQEKGNIPQELEDEHLRFPPRVPLIDRNTCAALFSSLLPIRRNFGVGRQEWKAKTVGGFPHAAIKTQHRQV
jgi:hypothetical protein